MLTNEQLIKLYAKEGETDIKILRDKYVSSRDDLVYDYIEERLAYTDFVKQKIIIEMLQRFLPARPKFPVDLVEIIEQEVKVDEQVKPDIGIAIKNRVNQIEVEQPDVIDEQARQQIDNVIELIDAIYSVLDANNDTISTLKSNIIELSNDILDLSNDLENANNNLLNTQQDLNNTKTKLDNIQQDLNNTQNELNNTKTDLTNTKKNLNNTQSELEKVKKQKSADATEFTKTLQQYQKKLVEFDKANKDIYNLLKNYKETNDKLASANARHVATRNRQNKQRNNRQNSCCFGDGLSNMYRQVVYGKCC